MKTNENKTMMAAVMVGMMTTIAVVRMVKIMMAVMTVVAMAMAMMVMVMVMMTAMHE